MSTDLVEVRLPTPFDLLQVATEKGVDADQLGKLVDLHERWVARQAAKEYADAMQAAQKEMPVVVRSKKGENSRYAPLEAVHDTLKDIWLKHGFSLSYSEEEAKEGMCRLVCDVRHIGGHTEPHTLEGAIDTTGPKGAATKTGIQGKGSTVSYLRRYLTLMIFDVTVVDEDNDGAAANRLIGPEEMKAINDLLTSIPFFAKAGNIDRLMKWVGVESWDALPQRDFTKVVNELNRQRAKGGAK